jgi:hypothetical protein
MSSLWKRYLTLYTIVILYFSEVKTPGKIAVKLPVSVRHKLSRISLESGLPAAIIIRHAINHQLEYWEKDGHKKNITVPHFVRKKKK